MSLTWLPKVGSVTEKNLAELFAGVWCVDALMPNVNYSGGRFFGGGALTISLWDDSYHSYGILGGYTITPGDASDLSITLPAWSTCYVYLVMDMAGGGIVTTGQRLIYYTSPAHVPNSLLLARCYTNATAVTSVEYLCPTRRINLQAYPVDYDYTTMPSSVSANTERSTSSTTEVLVKQFRVELPGVYNFSVDVGTAAYGTVTANVYCASTGDVAGVSTPQGTWSSTLAYTTKTCILYCSEADVVSVYYKTSNASYAAYVKNCSLTWYYGTPMAPCFLKG